VICWRDRVSRCGGRRDERTPKMKRALLLIAASAVVYIVAAGWSVTRLPDDEVAMQVNASGEVNRYATRTGAITYFLGLGGFLLVLAVAAVCLFRWVPVRYLNVPHKAYWTMPERGPIAREMIVWDVAMLFSLPLLALSSVPVNVALMTDNPAGASALWIIVPIGVWLIAMACYVIWMVTRRYRPPS
jgi:hypothetical protein